MDAATAGASGATARVLTITDADVVEGRTFTLDAGTPGNSGFTSLQPIQLYSQGW